MRRRAMKGFLLSGGAVCAAVASMAAAQTGQASSTPCPVSRSPTVQADKAIKGIAQAPR